MLETAIKEDRRKYYEQGIFQGKIEGKFEGERKGKAEGKREAKLEDAQAMLLIGLEIDMIRKITGLSEEEIVALQDKEQKSSKPDADRQMQQQQHTQSKLSPQDEEKTPQTEEDGKEKTE